MAEPTLPSSSLVQQARRCAFILYEGRQTAHRSCGIAIAETFGLPTTAYQASALLKDAGPPFRP